MDLALVSAFDKTISLVVCRQPKSILRRGSLLRSAPCSLSNRKRGLRHANVASGIRCESISSSLEGLPSDVEFCKVEAILRPWRLSHVAAGLLKIGIRGATISDVRGFGAQGGARERQAGSEFSEDSFLSKVKLEVVVSKDQAEMVIDTIIDQARTGEIGDGKIFVSPIAEVIRVRTGERGVKAERMSGARAEVPSSSSSNGKGT